MSEIENTIIRKTVSLPSSTWKQIEDYQFSNRIKRETEAVRRLIEIGLSGAAKPAAG